MSRGHVLWALAAVAAVGLLAWIGFRTRTEAAAEKERNAPIQSAGRVTRTPEGDTVLTLEPAAQARIGLETSVLSAQSLAREAAAYGRLEEDPSQSFILRAPIAGVLHSAQGGQWPSIGQNLAAGAAIGSIEPRFAPVDRITLSNQLATARSEVSAATAAATAAQAAYERARLLNADNKNVSDRVLQEAEARLRSEEARLKAANDTVGLLESSLKSGSLGERRPLVMDRGGDVVEVMAQPGEVIESGAPILRVTGFDHLLANITIPGGQGIPTSVATARIVALGYEDQPLPATRVAYAPTIDAKTQGQSVLFRLAAAPPGLRPGLAVTAYLSLPGAARQGVAVPRAAVVRTAGRAFAYQQTKPDQFVRKEVSLDAPMEAGYFTTVNFAPGARMVVVGAQALLSEEFKSQMHTEEEAF